MSAPFNRFPDPYQQPGDLGGVTIVLIAVLMLASVGGSLFFGGAALRDAVNPGPVSASPTNASASTPSPAPPLAGIAYAPRPTATPRATATSRPTPPATPTARAAANPNLARQLAEWKAARVRNGQNPNDYAAFRQHEKAIGAPDPGPVPFPGFAG